MIPPFGTAHGEDSAPRRIGPFRLCFEIASGGMGTVYLARSGTHHPLVAIKLIHPHLAHDRAFVQMFLDEAEIAARITHPNVCRVFDYDEGHAGPFIVMEHLIGEPISSIARRLRRRSDDPGRLAARIAAMLADACRGLHAAHELTDDDGDPLEVVHRDVTPGNLFLTLDGVTKVVDFGVASGNHRLDQSKEGVLKGKLAYVSPEVLAGSKPDRRADVWGIGVVAWELLTGERLFRRDGDMDTLRAVQTATIEPPSALRPGLPAGMDAVVMKALSRDPADRHATARELARDLMTVGSAEEVVTSSELAEWMEELFPGARERAEQLCRVAAQLPDLGSSMPPPPVTAVEPTPAPAHRSEPSRTVTRVPPRSSAPRKLSPPSRDRRWRTTIGVGGVCLGFGIAYLLGPLGSPTAAPPTARAEIQSGGPPQVAASSSPTPPRATEWETELEGSTMNVTSGELSVRISREDDQLVVRVATRDAVEPETTPPAEDERASPR